MRRLSLAMSLVLALLGLAIVGSAGAHGLPEVGFPAGGVNVAEDTGQVDVAVSLNTSSTLTVTAGYVTQEGSAFAGQDFLYAAGTVTFTPGVTLGIVSIQLVDDGLPEQDESFFLVLTGTQNAALGLYSTMPVTIADDGDLYAVYLPLLRRPMQPPVLNPIDNAEGDESYVVSWSKVAGAEFYLLQEDDNTAFISPVDRAHGYETSWNATDTLAGTYYYRVRVDSTMGHNSGWSNVQQVTVLPKMANVYLQNDTGGSLCYEVYGTGIGEKCSSSAVWFYGSFRTDTYTWHASAWCGSASGTLYYGEGNLVHRFSCGQAYSFTGGGEPRGCSLRGNLLDQPSGR